MRQLENTIFRAVVLCDGTMLDVCDFPQIAAAMGVEAVGRARHHAPTPQRSGAPRRARAAAPVRPMRCSRGRRAGHIRKFEEMESEIIRMAIAPL